ncbi:hypothetical protein KP509_03G064500 [Ceratopteris richardii]|uniref:Protein MIZU-KUSSEI 1 n=1 Tax=Ceratopteris richardii TaxID=49495 RepID=A0A8T2V841_CERRI|nr:hypothetical protein KP509_03G064500 [Ceratopteris richardii]
MINSMAASEGQRDDQHQGMGTSRLSNPGLTTPERLLMNNHFGLQQSASRNSVSNAVQDNAAVQEELIDRGVRKPGKLMGAFRSLCHVLPLPAMPCKRLTLPSGPSAHPSLGSRVTGTLFGYRKGHVHFAVQEDAKSHPVLLLELATPTSTLVKEMASGLVRIALECERGINGGGIGRGKLFNEPVWTMYCNGRKTGYALRRTCSEADVHLLSLVQAVSMGAGVLPTGDELATDGELMYMRAKFERVVGSRDSEAFYMMNPDGTGGPELSIFLLRV